MSSSTKNLVSYIDQEVTKVVLNGENPVEIFIALSPRIDEIKNLMKFITQEELNKYCEAYEGFCLFIAFMENLVEGVSSGKIGVPTYH